MKPMARLFLSLMIVLMTGCSLSPEDKQNRVESLKQTVESFIEAVVQTKWDEVYKKSDGSFETPERLKNHLAKPWVQDATLTGGEIASMAWVNDDLAKVKLNWVFQAGSVQSFSSETSAWVWKGNSWKYKGRTLR